MKKQKSWIVWLMIIMLGVFSIAATRGFVPRADNEGSIGTVAKSWATAYIHKITAILGFYIVDTATGMYVDGDGNFNFYDAVSGGYTLANLAAGGGGAAFRIITIPAGSFDYPSSNPAPLNTRTMTNVVAKEHLFDDTTEEIVLAQWRVPYDYDSTGTSSFILDFSCVTAAANEVQFRFSHAAVGDDEDIDTVSFTTEDSGDFVCSSIQNDLDQLTWTETGANLGWAIDDMIWIKVTRIAITDGTKVSGDIGVFNFSIKYPRS